MKKAVGANAERELPESGGSRIITWSAELTVGDAHSPGVDNRTVR